MLLSIEVISVTSDTLVVDSFMFQDPSTSYDVRLSNLKLDTLHLGNLYKVVIFFQL